MDRGALGSFIAERRKAVGLTQRELAEQLHITDKAVSKWERALSYPDITLLSPLAEHLNVPVERLLLCGEPHTEAAEEVAGAVLEISKESLKRAKLWSFLKGTVSPLLLLAMALSVFITGFHRSVEDAKLYFESPAVLAERTDEGGVSLATTAPTQ